MWRVLKCIYGYLGFIECPDSTTSSCKIFSLKQTDKMYSNKRDENALEHGNVKSNIVLQFWNNYMTHTTEALTSCPWHYLYMCARVCVCARECECVWLWKHICFNICMFLSGSRGNPIRYLDSNKLFNIFDIYYISIYLIYILVTV